MVMVMVRLFMNLGEIPQIKSLVFELDVIKTLLSHIENTKSQKLAASGYHNTVNSISS